ncbi:putative nicotinamide N-methyase [Parabacteroides sp. PF5-5]|uniref:SAM-dependent methyltransferase n=1 Tax=unclassified Parabacteroides TaxID=2649774 RepID=UPI002476AA4F|nr:MULTISPECIES: SAM-dependent methyltransferase [unclassified Parabacteroides]MDH6306221.1 putative nicotinamide N-methyase [Parabacteroides sp. PH5-39]MDH6317180.1 putative nicotinamide N-methyase [Parabacteroides sp. PF5-13]MDH6320933.1 putative nicotinamide N-methyase [Parabacteroides sp. PH5-13]MDH6324664.1 putative nicotinamide N-methyase [Parabacteroides sp. PH5-8]MDH6328285.1 putative nicotinamide N-methyase [Parabacteroides sp. PH5-41]
MNKNELISASKSLLARLQKVDYDRLPISDYNKQYIRKIYPALAYYMEIYADCLYRGISSSNLSPENITLVDYGGGSGFLSMLAKEIGIGQVIYVDLNPLSVETIKVLKHEVGTGPDIILPGSSDALADWCQARQIQPQLLIATDLIEHVYNLSAFFTDLCRINNEMELIFTTGSTPYNPFVKRKLHRFMKDCESGVAVSPGYYARREQYLRESFPELTEEQLKVWASCTRGVIYDDIKRAVETNHLPFPEDKYNTCDPETGNWAERILPIQRYRISLAPCNYHLSVKKGFYNTHRTNPLQSLLCQLINGLIRISGKAGLFLAPFITLHCKNNK